MQFTVRGYVGHISYGRALVVPNWEVCTPIYYSHPGGVRISCVRSVGRANTHALRAARGKQSTYRKWIGHLARYAIMPSSASALRWNGYVCSAPASRRPNCRRDYVIVALSPARRRRRRGGRLVFRSRAYAPKSTTGESVEHLNWRL